MNHLPTVQSPTKTTFNHKNKQNSIQSVLIDLLFLKPLIIVQLAKHH